MLHPVSPKSGFTQSPASQTLAIALAFLSYNMAVGVTFGVYGTLTETIQHLFSTSRTLAASGLSLVALAIGLYAPLVEKIVSRLGLRATLVTGALLCALGYALVTIAPNIYILLAIFAFIIGPGVCLLGPIPTAMLVTNHVAPTMRGRALGISNMPALIFLSPFATVFVLKAAGFKAVFLLLALLMLAFIPLLYLVRESPGHGTAAAPLTDTRHETPVALASQLFRRAEFWVLALGTSFFVATGMVMVTHLVSIGLDHGMDLKSASLLLSTYGICGAGGAFLFGYLADLTSVRAAFAIAALAAIPVLITLDRSHALLPMVIGAGCIGICVHAVSSLQGTGANAWLGHKNFGRSMGMIYFFQVPFLVGAAPLAGFLVDRTHSYHSAIYLLILALAAAAAMFFVVRPRTLS